MNSPASPASLEDVNILDILGQKNDNSEGDNTGNHNSIDSDNNGHCGNNTDSENDATAVPQSTFTIGEVTPGSPPSAYTARYPPCQLSGDSSFPLLASSGSILEHTIEPTLPAIDIDVLENLDLFLEQDFIPTLQLDQVVTQEPIKMKENNSTVRLDHMTTQQPITEEENNLSLKPDLKEQQSSSGIDLDDMKLGEHILDQFSTESSFAPLIAVDHLPDPATQTFDLDDLSTAENILEECMDTSFSLDYDKPPSSDTFDLDSLINDSSPNSTDSPSDSAVCSPEHHAHRGLSTASLDSGYDSIVSPSQFQFPPPSRCVTPESTVFQGNVYHSTPARTVYDNSPDKVQLIETCVQLQNRNEQKKETVKKVVVCDPKLLIEKESECSEVIEDMPECSKVTDDDSEYTKVKPAAGSKKKARKPYETYVALIAKAMLASGKMRLTLGEIYDQVNDPHFF